MPNENWFAGVFLEGREDLVPTSKREVVVLLPAIGAWIRERRAELERMPAYAEATAQELEGLSNPERMELIRGKQAELARDRAPMEGELEKLRVFLAQFWDGENLDVIMEGTNPSEE